MNGYSKVFDPLVPLAEVLSVLLRSYTSKSGGKFTLGASSIERLPLPEIVTISEAASFDLMPSLLILAVILKSPTPPANEAGAPAGKSRTLTCRVGVLTRLRMVWY